MPQDIGDDFTLDNRKHLEARDSSGAAEVVAGIDAHDLPVRKRVPRTIRHEFTRKGRPLAGSLNDGGAVVYGAPTGAAGDENVLIWPDLELEYHILGTQTILSPLMDATGLKISMDDTENDGVEICPGILASNGDFVFTVGTDDDFYFEAELKVSDVSDFDDLAVGFRKLEAYQANVDDYDEMAALNVISGDIKIETILNGADTSTTDTTDNFADTETHKLRVKVSAAGVVTYEIDGSNPTTTASFTFDDGEVVVPFIYHLKAASPQAGTIHLLSIECGALNK